MCVSVCMGVALCHNPIHQGSNTPPLPHSVPLYSLSLSLPSLCLLKRAKLRSCRCSSHASLATSPHLYTTPPSLLLLPLLLIECTTCTRLSLSLLLVLAHLNHNLAPAKIVVHPMRRMLNIFNCSCFFSCFFIALKQFLNCTPTTQLTINRHQRQKGAWLFACCCRCCLCLVASLKASLSRDKVGGGEAAVGVGLGGKKGQYDAG